LAPMTQNLRKFGTYHLRTVEEASTEARSGLAIRDFLP
jgi:hypothetical protein